jgi:hypothetical protein
MKSLLVASGAVLVLANAAVVALPSVGLGVPVQAISALLGAAVLYASLRRPAEQPVDARTATPPPPSPVPAPPAPPAPAPAPAPARAEAEIVALLGLLQDKGRLVDFVNEDLAAATDAQVGAAARVVHAGCRSVLREYFDIVPVRTEAEGSRLVLNSGYDAAAHRLLGTVAAQPPYAGRLVHPGWQATAVRLPRVSGLPAGRAWPVVAPAEVEVG